MLIKTLAVNFEWFCLSKSDGCGQIVHGLQSVSYTVGKGRETADVGSKILGLIRWTVSLMSMSVITIRVA